MEETQGPHPASAHMQCECVLIQNLAKQPGLQYAQDRATTEPCMLSQEQLYAIPHQTAGAPQTVLQIADARIRTGLLLSAQQCTDKPLAASSGAMIDNGQQAAIT